MSGLVLKIIAILSMLTDHIGYIFFPTDLTWRYIGRIAFPLYCFLLTEGFFHTRSREKYLLRMAGFAVISEIPFDLALYHMPIYRDYNNVFWTLLIGLAVMYFSELVYCRFGNRSQGIMFCFVGMILAEYFHCDYGSVGVLAIYIFYLSWESRNGAVRKQKWLGNILMLLSEGILFWIQNPVERYAVAALFLILLYSGKRGGDKLPGKLQQFIKYFFCVFYPLHLFILYLISVLL